MEFNLLDLLLNLDGYLELLLSHYGSWIYAILFAVVFCETGLVVMPFLPGDSLLFLAGALGAVGGLDIHWLLACLGAAALLGDSTNYWIGRRLGGRLFSNPDSRLFRRAYLIRTEAFYARHGGKTVTLARFLPVVRTFAPFVAGIGQMRYARFLAFSALGNLLWVGGLCLLGYFFGNLPLIRDNLTLMIVSVFGITLLLPLLLGALKPWRWRRA